MHDFDREPIHNPRFLCLALALAAGFAVLVVALVVALILMLAGWAQEQCTQPHRQAIQEMRAAEAADYHELP